MYEQVLLASRHSIYTYTLVLLRIDMHLCAAGVGDYYTDPQILSIDGKGYGIGNIGLEGIIK
jgi:hypothetical protein